MNSNSHGRQSRSLTRTVEAFADAIDIEIRAFDNWCADQEAAMCSVYISSPSIKIASADVIASLLHLSKCLSDTFEHTFPVLLWIVKDVMSTSLSSSSEFKISYVGTGVRVPAVVTSRLLDVLFSSVQAHLEREEVKTSGRLMRVFVKTAEPVWGMCGRWLKDGMGSELSRSATASLKRRISRAEELDDEFFIEEKIINFGGDAFLGLLDFQFWREVYGLRKGAGSEDSHDGPAQKQKAIPMFLEHVAEMILRTGKAVGLIRALGSDMDVFGDSHWQSFKELVAVENAEGNSSRNPGGLFSVSIDTLSRLVYERLLPHCQMVGVSLTKILVGECRLWKHLEALEDLMLMRRGDAMSHFIDVVFNKVSLSGHGMRILK